MEENEYKDNEKVLCKTKGKLSLPHKKPEEVDYLVTEGNLVIEAEQPIRIPLLRIKVHRIGGYELSAVELIYLDDLNQKQRLSLEMAVSDTHYFDYQLSSAIDKAKAQWLESLPVEKSWFARHLNWTLVLSWIFALVVYFAFGDYISFGFHFGSLSVQWSPIISIGGFGGWVVLVGSLTIVFLVTGWVLRKKNRSVLNLLWYLVFPPIGAIIILCLGKQPKIA